jgi:Zn-dependent oligopeptidase
VYLNEPLFRRVDVLYARREELGLDAEQVSYCTAIMWVFRAMAPAFRIAPRPGSPKSPSVATLGTEFSQNVLADENAYLLLLTAKEDLTGLPPQVVYAAAQAAADRGALGKHAVTLSRSSVEPFLQFSARRDLRENAFRAWVSRGETEGPTDNRAIAAEMVRLRAERARLLGFVSFAHYRLDDTMAKTPQAVQALLRLVWEPARAQAQREEGALQAIAAEGGENFKIAPRDWRYYAEKHRKRAFDFDESEIKPYLQLENMINAALISGTNVSRDFVEFPSQLYEHWLEQRQVLARFALHFETNEAMPEALLEKLLSARRFNQGFATVEYTASALVDLALHLEHGEQPIDIVAFENKELKRLGLPAAITMRHRTPHFQHIFAGDHSRQKTSRAHLCGWLHPCSGRSLCGVSRT